MSPAVDHPILVHLGHPTSAIDTDNIVGAGGQQSDHPLPFINLQW